MDNDLTRLGKQQKSLGNVQKSLETDLLQLSETSNGTVLKLTDARGRLRSLEKQIADLGKRGRPAEGNLTEEGDPGRSGRRLDMSRRDSYFDSDENRSHNDGPDYTGQIMRTISGGLFSRARKEYSFIKLWRGSRHRRRRSEEYA
jgi:hypothetical protein